MYLKDDLSLSEKLDLLPPMLAREDVLASNTEGSKAIVLIAAPKEEDTAVRALQMRFPESLALVSIATELVETAHAYGIENLESDFSFSSAICIQDFAELFRGSLVEKITQSSNQHRLTVIHRLGILNGFFGLNPIIEGITGKLGHPVLFIYPGKKKAHILSFLDGRHTTSLYRAVVL